MFSKFVYSFNYKLVIVIVLLFYFLISFFSVLYLHYRLKRLDEKYIYTKKSLEECIVSNNELSNELLASQNKYKKVINSILKEANKDIDYIKIPIDTKGVCITLNECKKMAKMIDLFIRKENLNGR